MQRIRDTMKTLDKNGEYHLSFRIICSISIAVSASGFLPDDKGSIPLCSAKSDLNIGHLAHNQDPYLKLKLRFRSSMVEHWSVKPEVESSNLSGIAKN
jgi:hypothetical protein